MNNPVCRILLQLHKETGVIEKDMVVRISVTSHRSVKILTGLTEIGNAAAGCGLTLTGMSHGKWLWAGNPVALSTNLYLAPF